MAEEGGWVEVEVEEVGMTVTGYGVSSRLWDRELRVMRIEDDGFGRVSSGERVASERTRIFGGLTDGIITGQCDIQSRRAKAAAERTKRSVPSFQRLDGS